VEPDTDRRPVRRAGHARLASGATVTWSVAEGAKGRRWRELVARDGTVVHSLLLETFPDGRFAHLELSTAAGLLTLHPEGDGTLHGNAVTEHGVRHVRGLPWSDRAVLLVEGSVLAWAAAAGLATRANSAVVVAPDLSLHERAVAPVDLRATLDADGLPILDDGRTWPLEDDG